MPFYIIALIVQVAFVIHIVKTGRSTTWIWIVVMLPMAGSIAYFILEILPELISSNSGRKAKNNFGKLIDPDKDIKQATQNYSIAETVDNAMALADAFVSKKMFDEAKQLYKKCLKGIHKHDPDIMHKLATVEFELDSFNEVKKILDDLIAQNPDFKNADAHLLYAKTLEQLKQTALALEEYSVLDNYYLGPEASYRYAMLLKKQGDTEKSIEIFKKIILKSKSSGKHYNALYKEWIKRSADELTS